MIIPKKDKLSAEELKQVEKIAEGSSAQSLKFKDKPLVCMQSLEMNP